MCPSYSYVGDGKYAVAFYSPCAQGIVAGFNPSGTGLVLSTYLTGTGMAYGTGNPPTVENGATATSLAFDPTET